MKLDVAFGDKDDNLYVPFELATPLIWLDIVIGELIDDPVKTLPDPNALSVNPLISM
jgi:hypothetical protein